MSSSYFDLVNSIDITDAADFIPQIWALETVAAYKANLVVAGLVSLIPHVGKIGNTINIPFPGRSNANLKTASNDLFRGGY